MLQGDVVNLHGILVHIHLAQRTRGKIISLTPKLKSLFDYSLQGDQGTPI